MKNNEQQAKSAYPHLKGAGGGLSFQFWLRPIFNSIYN